MAEKNELEKAAPQMPAQVGSYHYGSGNIFQNVNTVNIYKCADGTQQVVPQMGSNARIEMLLNPLSHELFSIFVLEAESYASGNFSIRVEDCLLHTKEEIRKKYYRIDDKAIMDIICMPAILATKNQSQKESGPWQCFYLAKIDSVVRQGDSFRIEFRTDGIGHRQQALNEHCKKLGLFSKSLRTELDEIHWAIKEGNLLGLLSELGI